MDRFARIVLGYHGCTPDFADRLLRGDIAIDEWIPSENPYDWLGHGVYFWEHAPERARDWGDGGTVGAVIQLGLCLDLTDITLHEATHETIRGTPTNSRASGSLVSAEESRKGPTPGLLGDQ